jgi:hypothetical protein
VCALANAVAILSFMESIPQIKRAYCLDLNRDWEKKVGYVLKNAASEIKRKSKISGRYGSYHSKVRPLAVTVELLSEEDMDDDFIGLLESLADEDKRVCTLEFND